MTVFTDAHPCSTWGRCSQNCSETSDSYTCSCFDGYLIEPDEFTCKPAGIPFVSVICSLNFIFDTKC